MDREILKDNKELSYARMQYNLGMDYLTGNDVEKNYKKAVECFTKSAEKGFPMALNQLGKCYYKGLGIERNEQKAVECFIKATEQGNLDAYENLGKHYYCMAINNKDAKKQEQYYEKSLEYFLHVKQPSTSNIKNIIQCYKKIINLYEKENIKVEEILTNAFKFDSPEILLNVGEYFEYGYKVTINLKRALEFYKKATEYSKGINEAYYTMLYFCLKYKDEIENSDVVIQKYVNEIYEERKSDIFLRMPEENI